jgi:hypothetical protein
MKKILCFILVIAAQYCAGQSFFYTEWDNGYYTIPNLAKPGQPSDRLRMPLLYKALLVSQVYLNTKPLLF